MVVDASVFTPRPNCQLAMLHVTFLLCDMPKFLTCPKIAQRTGYSRVHVARLARQNGIPGDRITTRGGHYRCELTPGLAEWIHKIRCPARGRIFRNPEYFMCRARRQPHRGDTALVCEEIGDFIEEIAERVSALLKRKPSGLTIRQVSEALSPAIIRLMKLDLELKQRLPQKPIREK